MELEESSNQLRIRYTESRMIRFVQGFGRAYWNSLAALTFLKSNPRTIPYVVLPLMINVSVALGSFYLAFFSFAHIFPIVWPGFELSWAGILAFFYPGLLEFVFHLVIHTAMFVGFYILGFSLVCSYFYGWFVERIEGMLGLQSGEAKALSVIRQVGDALLISVVFLVGNIFLGLFSLFPILGPVVTLVLSILFQSFCLGFEFHDFTLSIRGLTLREKLQYTRKNLGTVLGVGNLSWLFLFIPILNGCLFTLSILGATFIHRKNLFLSWNEQLGQKDVEVLSEGKHFLLTLEQWKKLLNQESFEGEAEKVEGVLVLGREKTSNRLILFNSSQRVCTLPELSEDQWNLVRKSQLAGI